MRLDGACETWIQNEKIVTLHDLLPIILRTGRWRYYAFLWIEYNKIMLNSPSWAVLIFLHKSWDVMSLLRRNVHIKNEDWDFVHTTSTIQYFKFSVCVALTKIDNEVREKCEETLNWIVKFYLYNNCWTTLTTLIGWIKWLHKNTVSHHCLPVLAKMPFNRMKVFFFKTTLHIFFHFHIIKFADSPPKTAQLRKKDFLKKYYDTILNVQQTCHF